MERHNIKPSNPQTSNHNLLCVLCVLCGFFFLSGCEKSNSPQVVLYTSIDQPIAAPIIKEFERQTGIRVTLVTDSEASKTVGLAERLRAEKANPQADVYWGNEPFHTINLAEEGVLAAYESPSAKDTILRYRDPGHRWAGNGLRARVVGVHMVQGSNVLPTSVQDLTNPAFRGKVAMARPSAGTTGGHVACLYTIWGQQQADDYFRSLRSNQVKLLGGNSIVADQVAQGNVSWGLTDNDDVSAAAKQESITLVLPDQHSSGTLMIPTTVGLVAGAKHPDDAKKLIDYLLSSEVEQKLIDAKFAGWSVRRTDEVKAMDVDYREVARIMPQAVRRATAILEGRE